MGEKKKVFSFKVSVTSCYNQQAQTISSDSNVSTVPMRKNIQKMLKRVGAISKNITNSKHILWDNVSTN